MSSRLRCVTGPMTYVSIYDNVVGFIINRGRQGHEGFDREQNSLGFFSTLIEAANAGTDAARNERGAG